MMESKDRASRLRAPRFTDDFIISRAEVLAEKVIRALDLPPPLLSISFDAAFDEVIFPTYGMHLDESKDLGFDDTGEKILGCYDPAENVAYIDCSLKQDPRRPFTCWHEVGGHGILQGDWLRRELRRLKARGFVATTAAALDMATTNVLERQANLFASHAGAPRSLLYFVLDELLSLNRPIRYVGPGEYTLIFNGQLRRIKVESFNDLCRVLARQIQRRFGFLSIEALSYRIESLPFVQDVTAARFRLHRRGRRVPTLSANSTTPISQWIPR